MNWKNSDFQVFYHILGNCHTSIEALRVLSELRQDRSFAIKSSLAEAKRSEAKVLAAKRILSDKEESVPQKLRSLCDIEEQDARMEIAQPCYDAALHELAFIEYLIEHITSFCTHPITPLDFQRIQPIENAYDIIVRTHTSIALTGSPSLELINESRNSPYRVEVIAAITKLAEEFSKIDSSSGRIAFVSKSKSEVLNGSGIVLSLNFPILNIDNLEFPNLELLECQSFKQKALISSPTVQTTLS